MSITSAVGSMSWVDWLKGIITAAVSSAATVLSANPVATMIGAQTFTGRQLAIMAGSAAIVAVANFLRTSPLPAQRESVALLPGVHTTEQVDKIVNATAPGVVPTKEVAAAILGTPAPSVTPTETKV